MVREDRIINNLSKYQFIKKFLGNAIKQRLEIEGYTLGILTAQLLNGEQSESDLKRLDYVLKLGGEHCIDFKYIFRERNLPNKDRAIDGEIINMLAEIKSFEVLYDLGFEDITKVKRGQEKIVDFTATKNGKNHAVEVTRLGLTQSEKKEPKYLVNMENTYFSIKMISGQDNIPIFRNIIRYAIQNKYPKIKAFCQRRDGEWNGILLISIGRDYFIANRYAQNPFNMTPKPTLGALELEWDSLKQELEYNYLKHVIITIGKGLDKVIIHPAL